MGRKREGGMEGGRGKEVRLKGGGGAGGVRKGEGKEVKEEEKEGGRPIDFRKLDILNKNFAFIF